MKSENHLAQIIRIREGEEFIAVADKVAELLNPDFLKERNLGVARKFPDLVSLKLESGNTFHRIREIKFKLNDELVEKAIDQLHTGLIHLLDYAPSAKVDRIELVLALQSRRLKSYEEPFIGPELGPFRFTLLNNSLPVALSHSGKEYPVTLLIL